MPANASEALQVVAAAVTPVVLVSATAVLISGTNSRYISIADRMRTLAREFRDQQTKEDRRGIICRQMVVFERRIHLVSWAIRSLYGAVGCFAAVALVISATLWRETLTAATVPLFLIGIGLLILAVTFQLLELQESNHTIFLEVKDIGHNGSKAPM